MRLAAVQDSFSLPKPYKDSRAWIIRMYGDGTIWAETPAQTVRIQIYPWKQGEMGQAGIKKGKVE